ncbi:MAG: flagellar biosynthesis protein FlhF [Deltaproteobacteria bacterium]|nr:flagellar biosynthesis protein FlhF [Deltaproteobacteria bacterium]
MRLKKYQAVDMSEALRMIREELGPDAVILSTRQIKPGKGVFGLLGRPLLEVTAATDLEGPAKRPEAPAGRPQPPAARALSEAKPPVDSGHGAYLALQAEVESLREELDLLGRRPPARARGRSDADPAAREYRALEEKLDRLIEQTAHFDALKLAPGLRRLHAALVGRDLDPALAARIAAFLQQKMDEGAIPEGGELRGLQELVRRTVRVSGSLLPADGRQRVAALVGPTGVGKTTTLAKLAARFALQDGRKVGFITVDTFRIAAVEQLKTYAKIMALPLEVALDSASLKGAVEALADRDLVLIDTAGQSPRDEESLRELAAFFPPEVKVEIHLVLAVTTRGRDLERILRQYAPLKPTRLLLTKLDETECLGPLLGLPLASRLPLSYLTVGQNVPDDLEEATPARVAEYLCRGLEGGS